MLPYSAKESLWARYKEEKGRHDEMWGEEAPFPHWDKLLRQLESLGAEELALRKNELQRFLKENGVTYTIYGEDKGDIRSWKLDPIPFLIAPDTWKHLKGGLAQRATVLKLLLADLYGPQEIIKAGILPPELIFSDPSYLFPCSHSLPAESWELPLYAADISKGPDGRVWVISDRTQAPSGWGYALENRISMIRVLPELYESSSIAKITDFYDQLSRNLSSMSPSGKSDPLVVILTPGPYNETYFEHAYLAALQGFILVRGQDLMVKEGKVWLKTLGGLEQVDVIIRRVDSAYCDPLELYGGSQLGVPGLLAAVRQGNVRIANPLGSGILENPGIMAFFSNICRFFTGEDLLIPNLATWWCGHEKERSHVREHLDTMVIRHIDSRKKDRTYFGWLLTEEEKNTLAQKIEKHPHVFVGQEQAIYSTAPSFQNQVLCARRTVLRCFLVQTNKGYQILPGGLTRSASSPGDIFVSGQSGGISKDTWVLSSDQQAQEAEEEFGEGALPELRSLDRLPSNTAENLFWVGRYTVRIFRTVRLMQSVLRFQSESKNFAQLRDSETLEVLLKSLTQFTMTYPGFVEEEALLEQPNKELYALLVDSDRVGSLAFTLDRWMQSIRAVRDRWSYNTLIILDSIESHWKGLREDPEINFRRLRNGLDVVINGVAAFHGLNRDSIANIDGRVLYDVGRHIEQAMLATHLMRSMLVVKREALVEESLMKVMLQNAESLQTFRYRYRSHLNLRALLNLLLMDSHFPHSLSFTLTRLSEALQKLPTEAGQVQLAPEQKMILSSTTELQLAEVSHLIQTSESSFIREELDSLLALISKNTSGCADWVIQKYFSHSEPGLHTHILTEEDTP